MGASAAFPAAAPGANVDITSLKGTTTNDDAAAGKIGEIIESTVLVGAAVSLTTVTNADITSISLTAGDWAVWGQLNFVSGATTTITNIQGWIHNVATTVPTVPNGGAYFLFEQVPTGADYSSPVGMRRYSLSGTTTIYLGVRTNFGVSTMTAYGYIGARRVR